MHSKCDLKLEPTIRSLFCMKTALLIGNFSRAIDLTNLHRVAGYLDLFLRVNVENSKDLVERTYSEERQFRVKAYGLNYGVDLLFDDAGLLYCQDSWLQQVRPVGFNFGLFRTFSVVVLPELLALCPSVESRARFRVELTQAPLVFSSAYDALPIPNELAHPGYFREVDLDFRIVDILPLGGLLLRGGTLDGLVGVA